MSCVYFPPWFFGVLSIFFYIILTIFATLIVMYYGMRRYILANWSEYKCNPLFMPFVGMFGKDTVKNFNECIHKTVKKSSGPILNPYSDALKTINSGMSAFAAVVLQAQTIIDVDQASMVSSMGSILGRMGNVSATAQFLMIKIKTIFQKIIALYVTLLYAAWSIMNGMKAIVKDPIIKRGHRVLDKAM